MYKTAWLTLVFVFCSISPGPARSQEADATTERTFRLCEGVTLFAVNPADRDFTVSVDVRDLNLFANGPRETLFKVEGN